LGNLKFSKFLRFAIVVIVGLIIIALVTWTVTSPSPLVVLSQNQLRNGIFGVSSSVENYSINDGSGTYHFEFGLDYTQNLTAGSATRVAVYSALVGEQISSFFTRGVSLALQSSSVSINGSVDGSAIVTTKKQAGLQTFYFEIPNVPNLHSDDSLQVRILVSTIDVNYVGNTLGSYQPVLLNGTFVVSS
jgi:hypothetical protein